MNSFLTQLFEYKRHFKVFLQVIKHVGINFLLGIFKLSVKFSKPKKKTFSVLSNSSAVNTWKRQKMTECFTALLSQRTIKIYWELLICPLQWSRNHKTKTSQVRNTDRGMTKARSNERQALRWHLSNGLIQSSLHQVQKIPSKWKPYITKFTPFSSIF